MQAIFPRKVENFQFCIHMIKKHKCPFSATFSYQKMFVFISVFPNIYDTFNASSVKQSRWFAKSMSSKSSQAQGVEQLCHQQNASSIKNKGITTSRVRNCSIQEGKMRHSHVNQNELVAGIKASPSIAYSLVNGEQQEAEDVVQAGASFSWKEILSCTFFMLLGGL